MRTRRTATITELRLAIDGLPLQTRIAMLDGIRSNQIIVGAYTSADGICPMLAAHRAGGRTSFIAFAKAWDRFAFRGTRKCTARRASKRELLVLRAHLEASLLEEDGPGPELAEAIREHRELTRRGCEPGRTDRPDRTDGTDRADRTDRTRPISGKGDTDRSDELAKRPGWSWMRIMRRYDEYERALARLRHAEASTSAQDRERVNA
jgi:hypothetical protein